MLRQAAKYAKFHQRKKRWQRVVTCMAAVVVFCTTYALILPAITMTDANPVLACSLNIHEHTAGCYDSRHNLICGEADFAVHTHNSDCYDAEGNLACELPEIEAHVHTEDCYREEMVLTCTLEEGQGHQHTDDCYTREQGALLCASEDPDHEHTDDCYEWNDVLTCDQEEDEHIHDDGCYEITSVLICDDPAVLHRHKDSCYDTDGDLICGQLEVLEHVHASGCFVDAVPEEPGAETEELGAEETEPAEETNGEEIIEPEEVPGASAWLAVNEAAVLELTPDTATNISAVWYDASGTEAVNGLVNGEAFSCELQFTVPTGPYGEGRLPSQYQLTLDAALQADSVAGENCVPVLTEDAQAIALQAENAAAVREADAAEEEAAADGDAYTITLSGTVQAAEGQTEAALLGQSVSILPAQQSESGAFTYTEEAAGLTVALFLESGSFTTENYDLVVARQEQTNYTNALNCFTSHGQEIEEAAIYKICLADKKTGQIWTNLGCPYTLEMSWPNGLFTQVDSEDFLNFTYCKNPGSEPTELNGCEVTYRGDGNVTALTAADRYYPNSAEFVFVRSSAPNGLRAGQYTLTYNGGKDAFLSTGCYNSNSPIGTAGSFHIVAFDSAYLQAHTNGNVLAKNLYAGSNFGTSGLADELSYAQTYIQVNPTSASSMEHILAIGSENAVDFADNGNAFSINGTKLDRPRNLIQDKDTAAAPFIDLERVRTEIGQIAGNLSGYADTELLYTSAGDLRADHCRLELTTPSGVGVANYTASELAEQLGSYVQIDGFQSGANGTVVINVDCTGVSEIHMPQARVVIDGQLQNTSEVTEFSAGKVIWNFVNAEGVTINTHLMTGIILAPGATVSINQNLNGTVVADNVYVKAESHRTDFTGKVTPPEEDVGEDEYYVTVQKIETGYAGTALPGAEFDLYKWENNAWVQVNAETLVTGEKGMVMLRSLDASVAYKLVETKAPDGYVLKDGAFSFWVRTDKNQTQPNQRPSNFSGSMVEVGGVLLAANDKGAKEETTSLTIYKVWRAADGTERTDVTVESITVEVYQIPDGASEAKTRYETLTLTGATGWTAALEDLPLTGTGPGGNEVSYTYTVEEAVIDGYQATYQSADGVVTITNTENEVYTLPETGGAGAAPYTIGGLLLTAGAGFFLLYNYFKRRRGDFTFS